MTGDEYSVLIHLNGREREVDREVSSTLLLRLNVEGAD